MTYFVMGTGSRSMVIDTNAKQIYDRLKSYILQLRQEHPDIILISGMAEGWDEAIAKVGMREGIPYWAVIPNGGYGAWYWKENSLLNVNRMTVFNTLVAHAQRVEYVCSSIKVGGVHSNFLRNQRMVDLCDLALVYESGSSGTRDAVNRLKTAQKPYVNYPFTGLMKEETSDTGNSNSST